MCMNVFSACMSVYHGDPGAHRGQKRALDSLKLELQTVVSHCVGARSQTESFAGVTNPLNH